MPKETAPTKTPWRMEWLGKDHGWIMAGAKYICEIVTKDSEGFFEKKYSTQYANGELIVTSVNNHDDLVDAVNGLLAIVRDELPQLGPDLIRVENAIIEKAETLVKYLEDK